MTMHCHRVYKEWLVQLALLMTICHTNKFSRGTRDGDLAQRMDLSSCRKGLQPLFFRQAALPLFVRFVRAAILLDLLCAGVCVHAAAGAAAAVAAAAGDDSPASSQLQRPTNDQKFHRAVQPIVPLSFFVYEGAEWHSGVPLESCSGTGLAGENYLAVQAAWQRELAAHPWRTTDPHEAQLFVVPFDAEQSWCAGTLEEGQTHLGRMGRVLDALEASEWYQRRVGRDHLWVVMRWELENLDFRDDFFPLERLHLLKRMVFGRYWTNPTLDSNAGFARYTNLGRHRPPWRCTVTLPVQTPPELWREESYADWARRRTTFFFRGKGRNCYVERAQLNRNLTAQIVDSVPSSFASNDAASPSAYHEEIVDSQYCFVFACDDPQTSRFYDAVAAGCIPVVINDHFRPTVAPFSRIVDYDAFTLTIPEADWRADPVAAAKSVLSLDEYLVGKMHANLMRARRAIMWRHPQASVATMGLRTVLQECLQHAPGPKSSTCIDGGGNDGGTCGGGRSSGGAPAMTAMVDVSESIGGNIGGGGGNAAAQRRYDGLLGGRLGERDGILSLR
ncbi:unnamed protein product [Phaeothamnion confervicola]